MAGQRQELAVVHAAAHDRVDLDPGQTRAFRGGDAVQHVARRVVRVRHAPEDLGIERVEADGEPGQARVRQRLRRATEQRAVRGQRDLEARDAHQLRH